MPLPLTQLTESSLLILKYQFGNLYGRNLLELAYGCAIHAGLLFSMQMDESLGNSGLKFFRHIYLKIFIYSWYP